MTCAPTALELLEKLAAEPACDLLFERIPDQFDVTTCRAMIERWRANRASWGFAQLEEEEE